MFFIIIVSPRNCLETKQGTAQSKVEFPWEVWGEQAMKDTCFWSLPIILLNSFFCTNTIFILCLQRKLSNLSVIIYKRIYENVYLRKNRKIGNSQARFSIKMLSACTSWYWHSSRWPGKDDFPGCVTAQVYAVTSWFFML